MEKRNCEVEINENTIVMDIEDEYLYRYTRIQYFKDQGKWYLVHHNEWGTEIIRFNNKKDMKKYIKDMEKILQ